MEVSSGSRTLMPTMRTTELQENMESLLMHFGMDPEMCKELSTFNLSPDNQSYFALLNHLSHIVTICDENKRMRAAVTEHSLPTSHSTSVYTCGYTAPLLVAFIRILKRHGVSTYEELVAKKRETTGEECDLFGFATSLNNVVLRMWDIHDMAGLGIMHLIKHRELRDFTPNMHEGENLVSFLVTSPIPEPHPVTIHHACLFFKEDICFILDSWISETKCRPVIIRIFRSEFVIRMLNLLNNNDDIGVRTIIMQYIFMAPTSSEFRVPISVIRLTDEAWSEFERIAETGPTIVGGKKIKKQRKPIQRNNNNKKKTIERKRNKNSTNKNNRKKTNKQNQ